jgi:hypothetical protein
LRSTKAALEGPGDYEVRRSTNKYREKKGYEKAIYRIPAQTR